MKKTDLALQKILNSFGVEGQHTLISDARKQDPGLVLYWEDHHRFIYVCVCVWSVFIRMPPYGCLCKFLYGCHHTDASARHGVALTPIVAYDLLKIYTYPAILIFPML
jgi:hypothetical protein